jgi:hypothetical protein
MKTLKPMIKFNSIIKKSVPGLLVLIILIFDCPAALCGKVYIPKDTEISIAYKSDISSKLQSAPAADNIFEIAEDQSISGVKYIQKGDKVFCNVVKFKKPGGLGKGGEIEIQIDSVQTTLGKNIRVESEILKAKGKSKKLKAILLLPALGYGLLVKGDDAELGRQGETMIIITPELISISY